MRPTWDEYFLSIARAVSARADCSRRQHGAVIVKDHRIVSTGYNGAPAGHPGCLDGHCPRAQSNAPTNTPPYDSGPGRCIAVHAEANALLYADYEKCKGSTLYITAEPCGDCRKLIDGAGIKNVIWNA